MKEAERKRRNVGGRRRRGREEWKMKKGGWRGNVERRERGVGKGEGARRESEEGEKVREGTRKEGVENEGLNERREGG